MGLQMPEEMVASDMHVILPGHRYIMEEEAEVVLFKPLLQDLVEVWAEEAMVLSILMAAVVLEPLTPGVVVVVMVPKPGVLMDILGVVVW